ncbi:transcriptional regulator [Agrobacterium rubi]|uniref:helix-turn-helix domain-containing protein n=1 Tax=Agrobacterium rubi TaxID=28099 RepID=UPI00201B71FB|nr:helix-turn-helix transcriptional regulator [Agrobacterium rubi]MCL6653818.1 transcriptional regulator [Agrobacterium rubi]
MKKSPNDIDIHVGSRIRMRRVMLGLSQEKLGDGLGITFQQVQKYEKGTNRVGASRLQHISELLDVHISYFFEGSPGSADDKPLAEPSLLSQFMNSKEGISLARAFCTIEDSRVRRRVLELVQSLGNSSGTDTQKSSTETSASTTH